MSTFMAELDLLKDHLQFDLISIDRRIQEMLDRRVEERLVQFLDQIKDQEEFLKVRKANKERKYSFSCRLGILLS